MVNQQEINPVEIGWLCGIIEGEGSLTIDLKQPTKGGKRSARFCIVIVNQDAEIINKCVDMLESLGIAPHITERVPPLVYKDENGNLVERRERRVTYYVSIRKLKHLERLLNVLGPNFVGQKRHKVKMMKKFVLRRIERGNTDYDAEDYATIIEFYKAPGGNYKASSKRIKELEEILRDYT